MNQDRLCKYDCGRKPRPQHTACGSCSGRMLCHGNLGTCGNYNSRHKASLSPEWQGENIGYWAAHKRLRRYLGPARDKPCTRCSLAALDWAYLHNDPDERISEDSFAGRPFSLNPWCYAPMCRQCHKDFDRERVMG